MMKTFLGGLLGTAALSLAVAGPASAFDYGTAYMTSWSGCGWCAGQSSLSYTDDQIQMFESEMNAAGNHRTHRYVNGNVWAGDLVEDAYFGGDDRYYSDDGELWAYSGHGGTSGSGWSQDFTIPMCKPGSYSSCTYLAEDSRMGERSGYYANPAQGDLRWLVLATCFSVHTDPYGQWGQTLSLGLDMVMGYRGTSADSETTDEVLEDFAEESFDDNEDFKEGWFYAIEDWWVDDTGALIASGTTESDAVNRRDNLDRNWGRRPSTQYHGWFAWSWHEG